jgi:subtilisin family serine protease/P pilus assembly chaperone PapD
MNRLRTVFAASAVGLLALSIVGSTPGGGPPPPDPLQFPFVPGEVLLRFNPSVSAAAVDSARLQLGAVGLRSFRSGAQHWRLKPDMNVGEAIEDLSRNPDVAYVEPNYVLTMDATPSDPRYPELWGLNNTGQTGGTAGSDIDAERAWSVSTGSHNVVVAVIDTGVDHNHPDLAANMWTNPGEIPGNLADDDLNGFVDDVRGWDFVNNDNNPFDDNGHGTHVSGTIGASANNGIGVVGVNWNVSIVAMKFLSSAGTGSTANAIASVEYATDLGVDIMSNSWGGGGFSQALLDAINAAAAADIVFVAAAGNSGANNDVTPHYPSSYNAPNIIAVMATDHNDARSIWPSGNSSSFGATSVDIAAPGSNILSTTPGNTYTSFNGTSMATPHVSGAAALLRSVSPNLPAVQVRQILMDMADDVPALQGLCVSGGRLNAFLPIAEPDNMPPGSIDDLATTTATSNSLFVAWTATGDDMETGTASVYDLRYSVSPIDGGNFAAASQAQGEPAPAAAGTPQSMEVKGLDPQTTYYFAVKVGDEWGNTGAISNLASGTTLPPPTVATATSPDPLVFSLLTGQTAAGTLTITNAGVGTLDWTVPTPTVGGATQAQQEPLELGKGEPDPRVGEPVLEGAGGPDAFGYRWIDSDEPGGPPFQWFDISTTGTVLTTLDGDDELSPVIPLGFNFPFYGSTFDSVRVSTNGWMSFTSSIATGTQSYTNQPLPTTAGPENMIAALWDDLHFRGVNRAVYQSDGTRFVVQYTNVDRITAGTASLTFQMEIRNTGEVFYRYFDLQGQTDSSTVGIQNATKTDGLTVAFNTTYLHNNLEIRIAALPQWLEASPTSGRLFGGDSAGVTLGVDASGLDGGTYHGTVNVLSNDPGNPSVPHPVTLIVTGAPAIQASPTVLDFGHVFSGFSRDVVLRVDNTGTATLTVASIVSDDPQVTVTPSTFTVAAHGTQAVTVTYTPAVSGTLNANLTITSNASNAPSVSIGATGTSSPAPTVIVDPAFFSESLSTGQSLTRNLRVSNGGGSDLVLTLTADRFSGDVPPPTGEGGENGIERAGGPDAFGYLFRDSDEPGGPVFDWFDISTIGTPIPMSASNQNSGAIDLPFTFPFYGNTFSSVRVCTNGWLSFTSASTDSANGTALPTTGDPENLLAAFHDALHFRGVERARYYNDGGNRFIVQYTGVDRSTTGSSLTFQVILYPGGRIVYQYLSMTGVLNSATIGIQNATRTIGLPVSINQNYVHANLAIEFLRVPDWLHVSPPTATIPPGAFRDFEVSMDAGTEGDRVLEGEIRIGTNIPNPSLVTVPATLTIAGLPEVATVPASFDYGTRFVGYPHLTQLSVHNEGTSTLNVLSVTSSDPALIIDEPTANAVFPVVPGGQVAYTLRWLPSVVGPLAATLTVESDDPDEPIVSVPIAGNAVVAPVLGFSPGSFSESLDVGETSAPGAHVLTLTNTGGSDLAWIMGVRLTEATVVQHNDPELADGEEPPTYGPPQTEGAGGPDMFGYRWKDSDEPGGPIFDWFDISTIGTTIPFASFDDSNFGPIPIGFPFPFYGTEFTTVRASTNGFLTFTSTLTDSSNGALPSTGQPPSLLAVWHDDLNFRTLQRAKYYSDGARFIVQYTGVDRDPTGSEFTFQVILYPSGQIVYQYLTMTGVLNSATIGIQNEARTDGLTIVNNADYMHDNLAIQILPVAEWLRITPASGSIPAGGSAQVEIRFDATELVGGTYPGGFDLVTNDPTAGRIVIPANLSVTGFPAITATPPSLDFGTVFVGVTESRDVVVSNPGSDVLHVTSVAVNGEYSTDVAPFSVPVGGSKTLTVVYAPTTDGPRPGSIVLASNATGVPQLTVPLVGDALFPPIAGVDPASITAAAPPGGSKVKHLSLCNTGGSDLVWSSSITLLGVPPPAPPVPPIEEIEKGDTSQDGTGNTSQLSGGPDAFGYRWLDSDEPGGPVFEWFDISTIGTPINTGTSGDDISVFDIPIGFNFPFYGGNYTSVTYNTNGWISPTSTVSGGTFSRFNQILPTGAGTSYPENLLGAFWDDLDFNGATKGHYYSDGTRFIAQWTNVEHFPSGSSYTFQIILRPDGTFRFQYLSMSGTMNSHTVGIQNGDRTIGLTLTHNVATPYVHDGLAIEFFRPPDWLSRDPASGVVAAGACTDITLTMNAAELEDGDHDASLSINTNDPFHPLLQVPVLLHVGEVDLTFVDVEPNTLNLNSQGTTVKATLQLPEAYDPHDVVIETVCLFGGALCANPSPIAYADENLDGIQELIVKFDRAAFEVLCPAGEDVPIVVTGEVADTTWFRGTDIIRALRPRVTQPNGAEYLVAGGPINLTWNAPQSGSASSYTIWLSRDGGESWEQLASGVTGTSLAWTITGPATQAARLRVFAIDNRGVMGYDTSDADFTIAGALVPPGPIDELMVHVSGPDLVLDWKRPDVSLQSGPVDFYRVLRATSPQGPFVEIGAPTGESFADPLSNTSSDRTVFFKVIAVNAAGASE